MIDSIIIMVIMTILGVISSIIGCLIGSVIKTDSSYSLALFLELTAGIMTGIVCFDMLPEAFKIANMIFSLIGISVGIFIICVLEKVLYKKDKIKSYNKNLSFYLMQLIIVLTMSIDNIVEGIAIGSGLAYSTSLGFSILFAILIHNIPEGAVVGITGRLYKKNRFDIIKDGIIVGIFLGVGAFIGNIIGNISHISVAISLSIASGAMLYIVSCNLIPSSNKISNSKKVYLMYVIGIIIGAFISFI